MQHLEETNCCPECRVQLIDAGEELACPNCGIVRQKEPVASVLSAGRGDTSKSGPLGSYMGTRRTTIRERGSLGLSGTKPRYDYIKKVADHSGRIAGSAETCEKMIRRVGEKLALPRIAIEQACAIARTLLTTLDKERRTTMASVSAYSLVAACKIEGATSANVREIVAAHQALGRNVSSSSIIQLMLESPFKTKPRSPEDYLGRILAKLSMNQGLCAKLREERTPLTSYLGSLRETASELLRSVKKVDLIGKRPCALAASAVYSAEIVLSARGSRKRRITQKTAAECSDAAEYTIREQCATLFMPAAEAAIAGTSQIPLVAGQG